MEEKYKNAMLWKAFLYFSDIKRPVLPQGKKNAKENIIVLLCVNSDDGNVEMPIIVVKIIENNFVLQTQETFR